MFRLISISIVALGMISDGAGLAQPLATNALSPEASNGVTPDKAPSIGQVGQVCITVRYIRERILLGQDGKGILLELGGGACEPPGSGISDFSANFATARGMGDIIEGDTCPEFQTRIDHLWAARQHTRHTINSTLDIRAGPFVIKDFSDLFELHTLKGRRAAARWVEQTLIAVRPCWDSIRKSYDTKHYVVGFVYDDLGKAIPAAINAAVTQDRQREYERIHDPNPES